ncbi:MAG: histidine phosphatase family protein [Candidatus Omnitrophota bacterium]
MELFFIRHGETEYNRQQKYCGSSDVSINETGIAQALELKKGIPELTADVFFCSPYLRAQETAEIIFPGQKFISEPALRELNFGEWEGLNFNQIMGSYGELYDNWLASPAYYSPPGGESWLDFENRVRGFITHLLATYVDKRVVSVCHGGVIKLIVCLLLEKEITEFWNIPVDSATLTYFNLDNAKVVSYELNTRKML